MIFKLTRRATTPAPAGRSRTARLLRAIGRLLLLFVVVSVVWVGLYRFVPPPVTMTMLMNAGGGRGIHKDWTRLSRIDPRMARAVIGGEDWRFCTHHGFDFTAIQAAMKNNLRGDKRLRGGSTISQQTAKNAFLWQGGGYLRKGLEAWFTLLIEALWGKKRIMAVYLNIAETGIGTYGAEAAAQRYYRHSAAKLSDGEAARIAAVLPLPKQRGAIDPTGFTRRYGSMIQRRIGIVQRRGFDACLR